MKQFLIAVLLLLSCPLAISQAARIDIPPILNSRGTPIPNANISLCLGTATITGSTCSPATATGFTDITLGTACSVGSPVVLTGTNACQATGDPLGNAGFWLSPGAYIYCINSPGTTGKCYNLVAPVGSTAAGSGNFGTNPLTAGAVNGVVDANSFSGTDIFAKANAAFASASGCNNTGPCKIAIRPGSYSSVTTTLNCQTDVEFFMGGVQVTWTGTSGAAVSAVSTARCKVTGPVHILGTQHAGTNCILLGNGTANVATTQENDFTNITCGDSPYTVSPAHGFDVGVKIDGALNSGTYGNTFFRVSSNGNNLQGWLWKPTLFNHQNSNTCVSCTAIANGGDGFQIDGAGFNSWFKIDAEQNGGCGINFANTSTSTFGDVMKGGDLESNTADFCFGAPGGTTSGLDITTINSSSSTLVTGLSNLVNSIFDPRSGNNPGAVFYVPGTTYDLPVKNSVNGTADIWRIRDVDTGNFPIDCRNTGSGTGTCKSNDNSWPWIWDMHNASCGVQFKDSANTAKVGGICVDGTGGFVVTGTAAGDMVMYSTQAIDFSANGSSKQASLSNSGLYTAGNTQRLTADASPIAATTPGTTVFTWGALPVSANFSFHCSILYNQQTAAGGVGLSVQGATNAPTRLDAWGNIFTSNAGAMAEGNLANLTTTTATSVVTATPSAITTVFQATLDGTIQVGASASTLNILMYTGAGADTVTPKAGSFCTIMP